MPNSLRYLTAEALLLEGELLPGWALAIDSKGFILNVLRKEDCPTAPEQFSGILCSGFVNTHCHLELSHLHGRYPGGEGMAGFLGRLNSTRAESTESERKSAINQAIATANALGTVAFGDVSNTADSLAAKAQWAPSVYTHTFIELFGRQPEQLPSLQSHASSLALAFSSSGLAHSIVPHAPYSVSPELFAWVHLQAHANPAAPLSFHLLESADEVELFATGKGPLQAFLGQFPGALPPIASPLDGLIQAGPVPGPYLFVHLTQATSTQLTALSAHFDAWYALCPRSNQFLHNQLPDALIFPWADGRVTLGTDSLSSCPSLDLMQEAVALQQAYPSLTTPTLLCALTLNGASALGIANQVGSFRVESAPGVVNIQGLGQSYSLTPTTRARLLVPASFLSTETH
jgi:cytosine/adenosine deaminase-related metal-dependent hydrolase